MRETMFMSKQMNSESEGHEVAIGPQRMIFPREIPPDDACLVGPEVVMRETMFMPKQMNSESEGYEAAQRMIYPASSALSVPYPAPAQSVQYAALGQAPAQIIQHAESTPYAELAQAPTQSVQYTQYEAPVYELELSDALRGTHFGE